MTPGLVSRHDGAACVFLPTWTAGDMFAAFQLLLNEGIVRAVPVGYELAWSINAPGYDDPLNQHGRLLVKLMKVKANPFPSVPSHSSDGFRAIEDRFLVDLYTKLTALLEAARSKDKAPE